MHLKYMLALTLTIFCTTQINCMDLSDVLTWFEKFEENDPSDTIYKTLGVDKNTSESDIKKQYFKLSRTRHPDRGGTAEAFTKLGNAYAIASNPALKAYYDKGILNYKIDKIKNNPSPDVKEKYLKQIFESIQKNEIDFQNEELTKNILNAIYIASDFFFNSSSKDVAKGNMYKDEGIKLANSWRMDSAPFNQLGVQYQQQANIPNNNQIRVYVDSLLQDARTKLGTFYEDSIISALWNYLVTLQGYTFEDYQKKELLNLQSELTRNNYNKAFNAITNNDLYGATMFLANAKQYAENGLAAAQRWNLNEEINNFTAKLNRIKLFYMQEEAKSLYQKAIFYNTLNDLASAKISLEQAMSKTQEAGLLAQNLNDAYFFNSLNSYFQFLQKESQELSNKMKEREKQSEQEQRAKREQKQKEIEAREKANQEKREFEERVRAIKELEAGKQKEQLEILRKEQTQRALEKAKQEKLIKEQAARRQAEQLAAQEREEQLEQERRARNQAQLEKQRLENIQFQEQIKNVQTKEYQEKASELFLELEQQAKEKERLSKQAESNALAKKLQELYQSLLRLNSAL